MKRVWGVSLVRGWGKGVNITILFSGSRAAAEEEATSRCPFNGPILGWRQRSSSCPFNGRLLGGRQAFQEYCWPLRNKKIDICIEMR